MPRPLSRAETCAGYAPSFSVNGGISEMAIEVAASGSGDGGLRHQPRH